MRQEIRQLRQTIAHCPKLALVNGAVFLIAFWRGFRGRGSELAEFFCLALPALLVGFDSLRQVRPRQGAPSAAEIAGGWFLLIAGGVLLSVPAWSARPLLRMASVMMFATAAAVRWGGWRNAAWQVPFYGLALLIVPFFTQANLYISYPLRRISTVLSAGVLKWCGGGVDYDLTVIQLDGAAVAITDACSGIQQLEAMFAVAYLLVRRERLAWVWKIQHFLCLLPAVILSNALRIIVTILLYHAVGERAFAEPVHIALGWAQVVTALAVLFGAGKLFPVQSPTTEAPPC